MTVRRLPYLVLIICFLLGLSATFHYKQLFNDGAYWAFNIVNNGRWHIEFPYLRFATLLLQTPSVIAASFTSSLKLPTLLFCLGYFLFPFLAFLGLWWKYREHQRSDFLYIPILIFFLSIVPNWLFGVSIVNESIVSSWLLISYIIFTDRPRLKWITLFSLLIFFAYETGVIFLAIATYISVREKKFRSSHLLIYSTLGLIQVLNVLYRILPQNSHKHFSTSLPHGLSGEMFTLAKYAIGLLLFFSFFPRLIKWLLPLLAASLSGWVIFQIGEKNLHYLFAQTYFDRTWAIPVAACLLLICYENWRRLNFRLHSFHLLTITLLVLPALYLEVRIDRTQVMLHNHLTSEIQNHPGCYVVPQEKFDQFTRGIFIPTWSFPHLTALMNETRNIKSVFFFKIFNEDVEIPNNFCQLENDRFIIIKDQWARYAIDTWQRLNFTSVYP
jgi:hypothetical protein